MEGLKRGFAYGLRVGTAPIHTRRSNIASAPEGQCPLLDLHKPALLGMGADSVNRYPRLLLLSSSRLNEADGGSLNLLFRSILGNWPKKNLSQIYSSFDNGDSGFCSEYYQLGPEDRLLGQLFYRLKPRVQSQIGAVGATRTPGKPGKPSFVSRLVRLATESGADELVFQPRVSRKMAAWIERIQPGAILTPGYNLCFAKLALLISKRYQVTLVYYTPDDWVDEMYRSAGTSANLLSRLTYRAVENVGRRLVESASVRIAFNRFMQAEYRNRYGMDFSVLMHGDDPERFRTAQPIRFASDEETWIVCAGVFDRFRLPLLHDLDQACHILMSKGFRVRASLFSVNAIPEDAARQFQHVRCEPCPSHEELASVLAGADISLLIECFDRTRADGIRTSVSSKAHLFMHSGRPTIVYADAVTGVSRYAEEDGWAVCVTRRDPEELAKSIERILTDASARPACREGEGRG